MTGNEREFVLEQPGMPPYPYQWSNEIAGVDSAGPYYWSEPPEDCTQVWGVVFTLPDNGGYLAGWSCGEMDLSGVSDQIHTSLIEAAKAAELMAKVQAEKLLQDSLND
ncbi:MULTISPECIES: hypothetical protein [unclassified Pseudomonas]|uniref:hypothetical protein n=1 Tax=unclassified Pseudomonas TaxID=196821 RepID=UPI001CBE3E8D|nr:MULTISPECIES: hypothetical protein [unclassified Pseudomonas]